MPVTYKKKKGEPASKLQYVGGSIGGYCQEITLTTEWIDNKQEVACLINATDTPLIQVKLDGTQEEMAEQKAEWGKVLKATTLDGAIEFLCTEETTKPITLLVKGV